MFPNIHVYSWHKDHDVHVMYETNQQQYCKFKQVFCGMFYVPLKKQCCDDTELQWLQFLSVDMMSLGHMTWKLLKEK